MNQHGRRYITPEARRAQRIKLTLLLASGFCALLVACSGGWDGSNKILGLGLPRNDRKAERAEAAKVGSFHNRGLRFVGTELFAELKTGKKTKDQIQKFMEQSCTRFLKSEGRSDKCEFPTNLAALSLQLSVPASPHMAARDLSAAAQDYLSRIDAAGRQAYSSYAVSTALAGIQTEAANNLSGDELQTVLNVVAVSDSSAYYWETEGNTWAANASTSGPAQMQISTGTAARLARSVSASWFSWRRVFIGDMAGAIAGAFAGGGASGVGPGALVGSVYEASGQVIDHYL